MNSLQVMNQLQQQYGTADWTKWNPYPQPFFDKVVYAPAGMNSVDFYAVPAGNNDPNAAGVQKSQEDTNCIVPRQLGQNYLWVLEVRAGIFIKPKSRQPNAIATDASLLYGSIFAMGSKWLELFNRGVLSINIDSKNYLTVERPFVRCPAGFGLNLVQNAATSAAGPVVQFGPWIQNSPDQADVFTESPGLWIAPTQTISASITWPDGLGPVFTNLVDGASPVIQLGLFLGGYMVRASQ